MGYIINALYFKPVSIVLEFTRKCDLGILKTTLVAMKGREHDLLAKWNLGVHEFGNTLPVAIHAHRGDIWRGLTLFQIEM